jgi:hypothetical protein
LEHLRNRIFPTVEELGGYIRSGLRNGMDSIRNKFSSVVWDILVLKLVLHLLSIPKVVDKISDN